MSKFKQAVVSISRYVGCEIVEGRQALRISNHIFERKDVIELGQAFDRTHFKLMQAIEKVCKFSDPAVKDGTYGPKHERFDQYVANVRNILHRAGDYALSAFGDKDRALNYIGQAESIADFIIDTNL